MTIKKLTGSAINAVAGTPVAALSGVIAQGANVLLGVSKYGTFSLSPSKELLFTPNSLARALGADKMADDKVSFSTNDGSGVQEYILTFSVTGVNDGPQSNDDFLVVKNGKVGKVALLKNDVDPDKGDKLVVTGLKQDNGLSATQTSKGFELKTSYGVLTVSKSGAATFKVDEAFKALSFNDVVTYTVSDGKGGVDTAELVLSNSVNGASASVQGLDLIAADDTGFNSDNITSKTGVTLVAAFNPSTLSATNKTVELYKGTQFVTSVSLTPDQLASGLATFTGVRLAPGENVFTTRIVDLANVVVESRSLVIVSDQLPPPSPEGVALDPNDDTGASNSDLITSRASGLTLTGSGEPGITIVVKDGIQEVGTGVVDGLGRFTIDLSPLGAGLHSLTTVARDVAGNESAPTPAMQLTIVAPPTAAQRPVVTILESDAPNSPALASDRATSDNTPTVSLSLQNGGVIPEGAYFEVYDGDLLIGRTETNQAIFTPKTPLSDGSHNITAVLVDIAGSSSLRSPVKVVTVDTQAPSAAARLDLLSADDFGLSNTDNITNSTAPNFSFSFGLDVVAGTRLSDVTLYRWNDEDSDGFIDALELEKITPTQALISGTAYRAEVDKSILGAGLLPDGIVHKLVATVKDLAGNDSPALAENALVLRVDNVNDGAQLVVLDEADNTGYNASIDPTGDKALRTDFLTSVTTGLTLRGEAEPGSSVEVLLNNRVIGRASTTAESAFAVDFNLPEGAHDLTLRVTDLAGNVDLLVQRVTVDTTAPLAPSALRLDAADDTSAPSLAATTGSSDGVTKNDKDLTFTLTAEAGSRVDVYDGAALIGRATQVGAATTGQAQFVLDNVTLTQGVHDIAAISRDAAGNASALSQRARITVDQSPLAAVTALDLDSRDDTGSSSTDNVTSAARLPAGEKLTISATISSEVVKQEDVTVYVWNDDNKNTAIDSGELVALGTTQSVGTPGKISSSAINGVKYFTNIELSEGTHTLVLTQKDAAGNESIALADSALTVVIDNTPPAQASFDPSTFKELSATTVQVGGKLPAGSSFATGDMIKVFDGVVYLGLATIGEDKVSWTFVLESNLGAVKKFNLTTIVEDLAGNQSLPSATQKVALGSAGNDVIQAAAGEVVFGLDGNDEITGTSGKDFLFGGAGNDLLRGNEDDDVLDGGSGNDNLIGGAGNDRLIGGSGVDDLFGDDGNDFLNGGDGLDRMTGGAGKDEFFFDNNDSALPAANTASITNQVDTIIDWTKADDTLNLNTVTAPVKTNPLVGSTASYQAALNAANVVIDDDPISSFQFRTNDGATPGGLFGGGTPGKTVGYVFYSADGQPAADQVIELTGITADLFFK